VNGVYILLVKSPAHLQVVVGNETMKKAFTVRDRDALVSLMLAKLRAKDFDGALLEGVAFVSSTMRAHTGAVAGGGGVPQERSNAGAKPGSSWSWVVPLLIGLVVVWLVVGLLRALFGGARSPMDAGAGGGGGFGRSLLGGLFGTMAGMWMYDQFFGHGSSSYGADHPHDSGLTDSSPSDTDYSGSGGSFGDDSGGGDGGGGGDFGGGGDSGGGGDF
jgi:uncharacterized protein